MKFPALALCLLAASLEDVSSLATSTVASPARRALAQLVAENHNVKSSSTLVESKKDEFLQICDDLFRQNKGFSADLVQGEWISVLEDSAKPSRRRESTVTFVGDKREIQLSATTPHGNGVISSYLTYSPVGQGFNVDSNGKIVLRRIAFKSEKSTIKYRFFPRVRMPFSKRKGGWADFVYLDENMQVMRDNKGNTVVLMRPDVFEHLLEDASLRIPYHAAARLAFDASDKSMSYGDFKAQYEENAVAEIKAKRSDIAVAYDSAAINAFQASNRKMPYALFKKQYEANARSAVMAKGDLSVEYDAAAMLAYTKNSDRTMSFDDFKAKYEADAIAEVKSKQKVLQLAK